MLKFKSRRRLSALEIKHIMDLTLPQGVMQTWLWCNTQFYIALAVEKGQLVGWAAVGGQFDEPSVELAAFTRKGFRQKGIARATVDRVLKGFKKRFSNRLHLVYAPGTERLYQPLLKAHGLTGYADTRFRTVNSDRPQTNMR